MRLRGRQHPLASTSHRRARRTGVVAVVLLCGTAGASLALTSFYHLGVAVTAATLVAVLGGLPGLYLTWALYRDDRLDAAGREGLSLAEIADELAQAIGSQWASEAAARGLNDPYPLPVSWDAADASLGDPWHVLETLASSGAGWPPPVPGTWATSADALAGSGGNLADVLARVPTRRLVVLGEAGAGKTMLMIRLVLDLLARRSSGGPVPVLVSLASWDPSAQDLRVWAAGRLMADHPALAAAAPGDGRGTRVEALMARGLIVLVLDGLDEIAGLSRLKAARRIDDALRPGDTVVVTSRTQGVAALQATIRAAAVIQLRPLDPSAVASYLRDAAGPAVARWDPVVAALGTASPARQALSTPLMAGLAQAIYNPRTTATPGDLPDPAGLCALHSRTAVEARLLDAFIPAAYRPSAGARWTARQAETWLVFLARHLQNTARSPDLAWWQLRQDVPRAVFQWAGAVAAGIMVAPVSTSVDAITRGLIGIGSARGFFPMSMYFAWFTRGLPVSLVIKKPSPCTRIRTSSWARILPGAALGGVLTGIVTWFYAGPQAGLLLAIWGCLAYEGTFVRDVPGDLSAVPSPRAMYARDRRAALLLLAGSVLAVALVSGLTSGLLFGFTHALAPGLLAGALTGFLVGAIWAMSVAAYPSYPLARAWLALRRKLPWSLMSFLADAHQRGVLRQEGAVYQFRHLELQHQLAIRPQPPDRRGRTTRSRVTRRYRHHRTQRRPAR